MGGGTFKEKEGREEVGYPVDMHKQEVSRGRRALRRRVNLRRLVRIQPARPVIYEDPQSRVRSKSSVRQLFFSFFVRPSYVSASVCAVPLTDWFLYFFFHPKFKTFCLLFKRESWEETWTWELQVRQICCPNESTDWSPPAGHISAKPFNFFIHKFILFFKKLLYLLY